MQNVPHSLNAKLCKNKSSSSKTSWAIMSQVNPCGWHAIRQSSSTIWWSPRLVKCNGSIPILFLFAHCQWSELHSAYIITTIGQSRLEGNKKVVKSSIRNHCYTSPDACCNFFKKHFFCVLLGCSSSTSIAFPFWLACAARWEVLVGHKQLVCTLLYGLNSKS